MHRFALVGLCLALNIVPLAAQEAPRLTAAEVKEGVILLLDGETMFGWHVVGAAPLEQGQWLLGGAKETTAKTTTHFADGVLSFEYRQPGKERKAELTLAGQRVGLLAVSDKDRWIEESFIVKDGKMSRKSKTDRADYPIKAEGVAPGAIGFVVPAGTELAVRNITFRPAGARSLFSGKDLAGWKIFPGKKSTFAVVDGAINVKDGPGDLQSEGKFGDFLLQLECISNGKHLNSGVFFRCRPGEYQNGYEAQVRNQFTEKPTQKYLLEEYDPKTHKLLGKKEALYTAVDFGTGAIYRRQPARKEMSKDGAWFTMTVVAHGNHFATWVNGVQVVDWTDHRPPSDNARTGYRSEAGHISFQGHDPTTDLSFRNIRVQEYPSR